MQPLGQADAAAHADEAKDPNLGADVLLNGLLFAQIWVHLDADDKKLLRAVGRGVRALTDGLVVTLSMHGKSASELGSALVLWPHVQRLDADCDVDSAAVIRAAPLSKLKTLVVAHTGDDGAEWSVPALGRTAAAGLQELRVIGQDYPHPRVLLQIQLPQLQLQ
ncbi:hypothetical protein FOA52_013716 [Chlamydomonas sp. UWO 241]|nr:hypothetical protein FOA52_013716 [Chlamydomonas sp. UWO 241]